MLNTAHRFRQKLFECHSSCHRKDNKSCSSSFSDGDCWFSIWIVRFKSLCFIFPRYIWRSLVKNSKNDINSLENRVSVSDNQAAAAPLNLLKSNSLVLTRFRSIVCPIYFLAGVAKMFFYSFFFFYRSVRELLGTCRKTWGDNVSVLLLTNTWN